MPVFRPPTVPDMPRGDPEGDSQADRLFRYYSPQEAGQAVWKDPLGVWHQDVYPYQGGNAYRTFNNGQLISETFDPNTALASAQKVFMGGHVYNITDTEANELIAAGFQVGGHLDSEEQEWVTYAINEPGTAVYRGGDAAISYDAGGGVVLWMFADNHMTTVGPNGFYTGSSSIRNNGMVVQVNGVLDGDVLPGGGPFNAYNHPVGGFWWWPTDMFLDGSTVYIMMYEVTNPLQITANNIISLGSFLEPTGTTVIPNLNAKFNITTVYRDVAAGFQYIVANQAGAQDVHLHLGRCPIGSITNFGAWTFWNGSTWVSDQNSVQPLRDTHGEILQGSNDLTKVGDQYITATIGIFNGMISLYQSTTPQGPWSLYYQTQDLKPPQAGITNPQLPAAFFYYAPRFHEEMNPSATNIVMSYNRNIQGHSFPITAFHCSTFTPQLVYVPTP